MSQQNDDLNWVPDFAAKTLLVSNLYRLGIISKKTYDEFKKRVVYG